MKIQESTKKDAKKITGLSEEQLFDSLYLAIIESNSPMTNLFSLSNNKTVLAWGHPHVFSCFWEDDFSFFVRLKKEEANNLKLDYRQFKDHPVYIANKELELIQERLDQHEKKEFDDELLFTMVVSGCWAQAEAIERINSLNWLHKLALSERIDIQNQQKAITRIFNLPVSNTAKMSELKEIMEEGKGKITKFTHLKIIEIQKKRPVSY